MSNERFNIGDKVKCLFGNSGHKFWHQLDEELIIERIIRHDDIPDQISFPFDPNQFFYANDFKLISPKMYTEAEMQKRYNEGWQDGYEHCKEQVRKWRRNLEDYNTGMF